MPVNEVKMQCHKEHIETQCDKNKFPNGLKLADFESRSEKHFSGFYEISSRFSLVATDIFIAGFGFHNILQECQLIFF